MASEIIERIYRINAEQAQASFHGVATAAQMAVHAEREVAIAALQLSAAEESAARTVAAHSHAESIMASVLGVTTAQLRQIQAAETERANNLARITAEQQAADRASELSAIRAGEARAEASSYAGRMAAELDEETRFFTANLRKDGEAHVDAAKNTKQHAAAVTNLRFQLGDIATQLLSGQSPGMILVQQGPQVAEAIGMMDGGLKGLLASLIPAAPIVIALTAAVAVGAIAWHSATEEIRRQKEEAETWHVVNQRALSNTRALERAQLDLAVALGQVTEAEAKMELARMASQDKVRAYGDSQMAQRAALAKQADSWGLAYSGLFKIGEDANDMGGVGPGQMLDWVFDLEEGADSARKQIDILNQSLAEEASTEKTALAVQLEAIAAKEMSEQKTKGLTSATRSHAEAGRELARALKEQLQARRDLIDAELVNDPVGRENESYRRNVEKINADARTAGMDPTKALSVAHRKHEEAMRAIFEEFRKGLDADTQASLNYGIGLGGPRPKPLLDDAFLAQISTDALLAKAGAMELPSAWLAKIGVASTSATGKIAGVVGQDPAEAVAGAIEKIPIVGKILGSLVSIAANTGAFLTGINSFVLGVTDNLATLGTDISTFVADLLEEVVPALIGAVPALIDGLLTDLIPGLLRTLIGPEYWQGLYGSIKSLFVNLFFDIWRDAGRNIAEAVRDSIREWLGLSQKDGFGGLVRADDGRVLGDARTALGDGFSTLFTGRTRGAFMKGDGAIINLGHGGMIGRARDIGEDLKRGLSRIGLGNIGGDD